MKPVIIIAIAFVLIVPNLVHGYGESDDELKTSDAFVIKHVEGFHEHSKYYDIKGGKIVNELRDTFIYPYDPLTYQITIENPLNFDRTVHYFLNIKQGDVSEQTDNIFYLQEYDTRTYEIPFHLKGVGAYEINLTILLDDDKTPSERKTLYNVDEDDEFFDVNTPINRGLVPVLLDIKSPTFEILESTNEILKSTNDAQTTLVIVTIFLVIATSVGIVFSIMYTRKSVSHLERQLDVSVQSNQNVKDSNEMVQKELDIKLRPWMKIDGIEPSHKIFSNNAIVKWGDPSPDGVKQEFVKLNSTFSNFGNTPCFFVSRLYRDDKMFGREKVVNDEMREKKVGICMPNSKLFKHLKIPNDIWPNTPEKSFFAGQGIIYKLNETTEVEMGIIWEIMHGGPVVRDNWYKEVKKSSLKIE